MSDSVKWIKIVTDIFDDEKILLIESMPESDTLIVIWFKILCLAGRSNTMGLLLMNNKIPYNDEMLAHIFRRPINTIRLALATFEKYGMIEIVNDTITIPNWGKHQQLDALEKKREYLRNLMAKRRAEQKKVAENKELLAICDANSDDNNDNNSNTNSDANSDDNVSQLDIDIESDKELDNLIDSKESICRTKDVRRVVEAWNTLGLSQVSKIMPDSKRGSMLRQRVKQYGVDKVLEAIERIKKSPFLQGQTGNFIITFDWFVRPNNFPKVLEGQYDDHKYKNVAQGSVIGNYYDDA